jgi:hypothetical protein
MYRNMLIMMKSMSEKVGHASFVYGKEARQARHKGVVTHPYSIRAVVLPSQAWDGRRAKCRL